MPWNLAVRRFLSITFLAPFSFLTRSSFGRLKATVWTDLKECYVVKVDGTMLTSWPLLTRIQGPPPLWDSERPELTSSRQEWAGSGGLTSGEAFELCESYLFHFWEKRLVHFQLFRLHWICDGDKGLKCGFLCLQLILVHLFRNVVLVFYGPKRSFTNLIWTNGDLNL